MVTPLHFFIFHAAHVLEDERLHELHEESISILGILFILSSFGI